MNELIDRVYAWNSRKRKFTSRQIMLAAEILLEKGWVEQLQA